MREKIKKSLLFIILTISFAVNAAVLFFVFWHKLHSFMYFPIFLIVRIINDGLGFHLFSFSFIFIFIFTFLNLDLGEECNVMSHVIVT